MTTERAKRAAGRIYRSIQGENQPPFAQIIAEEYADLEAEVEAFHRPIWKGVALPVRGPTPSEMLKRIAELKAEMAELNLGEELDTKRIKTLEAENAGLRDALSSLGERNKELRDALIRIAPSARILRDEA